MIKTDSGSHGNDHFFPGPTDIAWDLAGAIIEWRMDAAQTAEFLELYHRGSGDDPGGRIEHFIRAYAVFRWAFCRMAAGAMAGTAEQLRLDAAAESYAAALPAAHVASGV
jgi:thiamine kinase-like enzyme